MADDMASGEEPTRQYQDAHTAQLGERVTNMGRRINDVEVEMRAGFNQVSNSLSASTNEMRQSIAALSNNLAERNKTQWPVIFLAIGVASSVLGYFVTQALTPIRDANLDMKASVVALAAETNHSFEVLGSKVVTREEVDWRSDRGAEDRKRSDDSIADLRANSVTRLEWTERNRGRDIELADLNRRVDEIRQEVGAVYGTRDVIQDMKKEIDNLRQRLANIRLGTPPP